MTLLPLMLYGESCRIKRLSVLIEARNDFVISDGNISDVPTKGMLSVESMIFIFSVLLLSSVAAIRIYRYVHVKSADTCYIRKQINYGY